MTVAFAGFCADAPTAVMTPFENTIVAFGMVAEETGTIVALRMATVSFLPGLLIITDCANADDAMSIAKRNALVFNGHLRLRFVVALARFLLVLRFVVRFFLQTILLFFRHDSTRGQVSLAVEKNLAIDERRLDARVGRERMTGPDHDVGVLAHVDRSDAVIEAELLRAIQRAEFQRFFFRQAAVLH